MLPSLRCRLGGKALVFLFCVSCSSVGGSSESIGPGPHIASSGKPCWERVCSGGERLSAEVYGRHRDHGGACRGNITGSGGKGGEHRRYGGTFFTECRCSTPNDAHTDGSFAKWCGRP